MSTCERFTRDTSGNLACCGKPAAWSFNYKYLDRPCGCSEGMECAVSAHATEGNTLLCEDCHDYDSNVVHPDNKVPPDLQYTRVP